MSCFVVIFVFLFSWTVFGQELSPRVGYVYPAGGKRGTVFELTAGGQFLRGVTNVYVSGGGVRATVLEHIEPISQRQAQLLRDRLKELQQKRAEALKKGGGWSAEEQKMVEDIRKKLANFIPPRDLNPSLADIVRVRLEVSDDAEPGERQIRFQTAIGLSNPNVFYVGEFDEFSRKHRRIFRQGREERDPVVSPSDGEIRISLPSVLNGQIMPGGVDRYRFLGKKGQKVVVMVLARQLIPYIPDAVPGWFQAVATIYNSRGEEVVRVDDFMFNPDPVLYFEIPADGDYVFEIRDAIYRGREDFVYRVVIGEIPFITGIFPAGATAGKNVDVELKGWNLPTNRVRFDFGGMLPGIYQYRLDKSVLIGGKVPATSGVRGEFQGGECAAVLVHLSEFPDVAESESNNSTNFAQSVMLPVVINGKISSDEDVDSFRFYAKGGEKVVVEVFARRLNSPLDSIVHLVDGNGDVVAANDDYEDKGSGLTTHHADSYLIATIPRDGIYYARISSAQRQGGDDYVYRLRISKPKPDFEIRMAPSELNLRQGGCNDLTVYALRKDGFDGDIWLSIKDAPSGFRLDGGRIPPGRDKVRVTISSPPRRFVEPVRVLLQASALINGKTVVRDVVASKEMVQAFAYHHLVPVNDFFVYVRSVNPQRAPVKLLSPLPVRIRPGFTARVSFEGPPLLKEFANLALSEPPEGIVLKNVVATRYGFDLVLYADREKVKPGLEDNLIVEMSPRPILQANQTASSSLNRRRINAGALPAIPIVIVP